jgi:GntR family transcriptional regulator
MLDPTSPMPLYEQVKVALRQSVESGVWQPGDAIPPERELIGRFGVSRITVRQAISDLVEAGLLYRLQGKGTFVARRGGAPIAESLSELTGHLEELQLKGLNPAVEVLDLAVRPLPPDLAEALRRPAGAEAWYLFRRVRVGGPPLMLSEVWLPTDLHIDLRAEAIEQMGMAPLLQERGLPPARGAQHIGAQVAGRHEAALLETAPGQALLRVVRIIYGVDDRPLVWFRTLYRADRYEYEVELKRRR